MQTAQFQLHAEVEERHWWFTARRQIVRTLAHAIEPPNRATTLVDVGCGTGGNLAAFRGDYRCLGIDTSAEAIALARRRFPQSEFICGHAPQDLGEDVRAARIVLLMDVLEHVPDDSAMFSSLAAACEPGTHLLVTVPADMALWSPHDENFGHYRRYDAARFQSIWSGLPVEPLLVSHFNSRLYPVVRLIRTINRRRGESAGAAGTDFHIPASPVNRLLERVFAGEASRLKSALGKRGKVYRRGVSLIAVLRKTIV
jgi:2-polyprenyl-3-methyl-5-hydroxy-6-metoxy-1,4-benzoquinol methylase